MFRLIKIIFLMIFLISVVACSNEHSYSYLIGHYDVLKQEVDKCSKDNKSSDQNYCQNVVMKAAQDFNTVLDQERSDPEAFGQKILDAQMDVAKTKLTIKMLKNKVDELKSKKSPSAEIQSVQDKVLTAKKDFQTKRDEVTLMLTVVGLNSPE